MGQNFSFADLAAAAKARAGEKPARTEDREPEPGVYLGKIVYAQGRPTASGNRMLSVKVEVVAPLKGAPEGQEGAALWSNQVLDPARDLSVDIFFRTTEAMGLTADWWGAWGEDMEAAFDAAASVVTDRLVKITVDKDPKPFGSRVHRIKFIDLPPKEHAQAPVAAPTTTKPARPVGPKRPQRPANAPAI